MIARRLPTAWRVFSLPALLGGLLAAGGCATLGPSTSPVSPEEIPGLQQRTIREPSNAAVHFRLGAALMAAGRCDEAVVAADRGRALRPQDPLGPLVIGQCLEEASRFQEALDLYASYIGANPDAPGVAAVEGRRVLALRRQARDLARTARENEENLGPADPERVGVLPFLVDGDEAYQPLQVGLANMLTTDLALLRRFPMVERVQLGALLDELQIPPDLVDPATAARTGRLLGASRMVLGTIQIPSPSEVRMASNIVLETGEIAEPYGTGGALEDLLELEKDMAVRTAEALGYQLTDAEIQRIRQNVPSSLSAFLAFSRGLMAEDLGNFEAAAAHYAEAVRADPAYQEAQQRLKEAVGAEVVSGTTEGEVTSLPTEVDQALGELTGSEAQGEGLGSAGILASTLASSIIDVASQQAERATFSVGSMIPTEVVVEPPALPPALTAYIRITITIPRF